MKVCDSLSVDIEEMMHSRLKAGDLTFILTWLFLGHYSTLGQQYPAFLYFPCKTACNGVIFLLAGGIWHHR